MLSLDTTAYNAKLSTSDQSICDTLARSIETYLPQAENKVWHAHPVWFIEGNPVVGYSKRKNSVRLMFWSGADFGEPELRPGSGKFKDASIDYTSVDEIKISDLKRWLEKSRQIQWDYKHIVKHKGKLFKIRVGSPHEV